MIFSLNKSTFEVNLCGATVTSWCVNGEEQLFTSRNAIQDGTKAIRGGIPLVYPQFGLGPLSPTVQHGFARVSMWQFGGVEKQTNDELSVWFELDYSKSAASTDPRFPKLPQSHRLSYHVTLLSNDDDDTTYQLRTVFKVHNDSKESFQFQFLFHSYLRVGDIQRVRVEGLQGHSYTDKVISTPQSQQETSPQLLIDREVDRVYESHSGKVTVLDGDSYVEICSTLPNVVLWNPWVEKCAKMSDLSSDQYKEMVCVEFGSVTGVETVNSGETWTCAQTISQRKSI